MYLILFSHADALRQESLINAARKPLEEELQQKKEIIAEQEMTIADLKKHLTTAQGTRIYAN